MAQDIVNGVVIDAGGEWIVNSSGYDFVDPTSGKRLRTGVPTKIEVTEWIKGQEVLKSFKTAEEEAAEEARKAAVAKAEAAKVAGDAAQAQADAQRQTEADARQDAGQGKKAVK